MTLKNKLYCFAAVCLAVLSACTKDNSSGGEEKGYTKLVTKGTRLRTSVADPCLLYRDGMFYLTMTGSTKLALIADKDLNRLTTTYHTLSSGIIYDSASDLNVEAMFGANSAIDGTWSPEIHFISNEDCPGYEGYYLFFALRKKTGDSRTIRSVILKSTTGKPSGPYGHPITGTVNLTQALLDKNGSHITIWNIGMSLLRIPSGKYKGLYGTFVDEVGRGSGVKGQFYQRLRIAKLRTPWQLETDLYTITVPTQDWEKIGSSNVYPEVVEGGTAVYGEHGEIFLAYCGSGYWSEYGLGQLTLKREGNDYCDPLKTESWLKYDRNPVFTSSLSNDLRGAGHAFFLNDDAGNRFMVYHAYPFDGVNKGAERNVYIETYDIDYSQKSATAPEGVLLFGVNRNKCTAPVTTQVTFLQK